MATNDGAGLKLENCGMNGERTRDLSGRRRKDGRFKPAREGRASTRSGTGEASTVVRLKEGLNAPAGYTDDLAGSAPRIVRGPRASQ